MPEFNIIIRDGQTGRSLCLHGERLVPDKPPPPGAVASPPTAFSSRLAADRMAELCRPGSPYGYEVVEVSPALLPAGDGPAVVPGVGRQKARTKGAA